MTLEQALKELFESDRFKEAAVIDSNLRVHLHRFRKNELKDAAGQRLLERFGYTIHFESPFKKKKSKK